MELSQKIQQRDKETIFTLSLGAARFSQAITSELSPSPAGTQLAQQAKCLCDATCWKIRTQGVQAGSEGRKITRGGKIDFDALGRI
jgi:hypothetical protein